MPYLAQEMQTYANRCCMRTRRHGNWRQIYIDCDGMCQGAIEDGTICGEQDTLEFHEMFGEDRNGEGKMQLRILLCNGCHRLQPHHHCVNPRRYPSMLQDDIAFEIAREGSIDGWMERYNLHFKDGSGLEAFRERLAKRPVETSGVESS